MSAGKAHCALACMYICILQQQPLQVLTAENGDDHCRNDSTCVSCCVMHVLELQDHLWGRQKLLFLRDVLHYQCL